MNQVPLGYEWPGYDERRKRLIDASEILTRLWAGERLDYDGHYWETNALKLYTLPDRTVPLFVAGNGPRTTTVAGRYADGFLTIAVVDTYTETLVPALEGGAASADSDPDDIHRTRQILVSYATDYEEALESVGFWRGVPAVGFDQEVPDPRDIEAEGKEMPLEAMTDTWLVTTDPAAIHAELEACRDAGFDEVEIHSASPDQQSFVTAMADEVLDNF